MSDARIDPNPGDEIARAIVVSKSGQILRRVTQSHGGFVGFIQDNGYTERYRIVTLCRWRNWARKAEQIRND